MELSNILTIIYQSHKGFTLKETTLGTENILQIQYTLFHLVKKLQKLSTQL